MSIKILAYTLLFFLLSPGFLLTLYPSSRGFFLSGQTNYYSIILHTFVLSLLIVSFDPIKKTQQNTKDNKLFATMHNVEFKPNYKEKIFEWNTDHPHYDVNTQKCIECIQNYNSTESINSGVWFCGAYMGYGFHEDGIVSRT